MLVSRKAQYSWCRGRESNPHGRKAQRILSPPRLPVPPPRQEILTLKILHDLFFRAMPKRTNSSRPLLLLAPMAGLTHAPLRELVASYGGVDIFFTEMLNVRAIVNQNPARDPYLIQGQHDKPLVAQLVGRDPELFALAVERLEKFFDFAGYDLNFGCARGMIQRYGWGVSLMKEPDLAQEIVRAVCQSTSKPVSVKLRSGFAHDRKALLSFVEGLVQAGAQMITLHPRTAAEGFKRPARWEEIKWLTQTLEIPVIGNGDVFSPTDAVKMSQETGCHGIMIGRAALLRPWIFRDVRALFQGLEVEEPPHPIEPVERLLPLLSRWLPQELQEKRFELWLFWYLQNFPFGVHYWREIKKRPGLEAKLKTLRKLLAGEKIRPYPARPYLHR